MLGSAYKCLCLHVQLGCVDTSSIRHLLLWLNHIGLPLLQLAIKKHRYYYLPTSCNQARYIPSFKTETCMHHTTLKGLSILLPTQQVWRETLVISSEMFPDCPDTTPELPKQPVPCSEFDLRYTPKRQRWTTESDEADNTWQRSQ